MDATITAFLARAWQGAAYSYYFTLPDHTSTWMRTARIKEPPANRQDVYFGLNGVDLIPPVNARGEPAAPSRVRARIESVSAVNFLFADLDRKANESDSALLERAKKLRPTPSVIVKSGTGLHVYILFAETLFVGSEADRVSVQRLQARFVKSVGGEGIDIARAPRLPGTLNHKYEPPRAVSFLRCDLDRAYTVQQVRACLPPPKPLEISLAPLEPAIAGPELTQRLVDKALNGVHGSRNEGGFWLAVQLRDNLYTKTDAENILEQYARLVPQDKRMPYLASEAKASVNSAYRKGAREPLQERRGGGR